MNPVKENSAYNGFRIENYINVLEKTNCCELKGRVLRPLALLWRQWPELSLGELCFVRTNRADRSTIPCEVVGFKDAKILLMPLGPLDGIGPGSELLACGGELKVSVGAG